MKKKVIELKAQLESLGLIQEATILGKLTKNAKITLEEAAAIARTKSRLMDAQNKMDEVWKQILSIRVHPKLPGAKTETYLHLKEIWNSFLLPAKNQIIQAMERLDDLE